MYSFVILGIIPGTNIQITFTIWCLLCLGVGIFILEYKRNADFHAKTDVLIDRAKEFAHSYIEKHNLAHIAGNEGFPIQLEVFKQQQASSIRSFLRQLSDSLKIKS